MSASSVSFDAFAEVRDAITLSDYVERVCGVKLRPHGQGRFSSACPVHGGDNPTAFSVDDDKGLWYCFSQCGRGGDIFSLWAALNNSDSKRDALVALAQEGGVELPERERPIERRKIYQVNARAAKVFRDALTNDSDPIIGSTKGADEAFDWLSSERGLTDDDMELAQVGFVPDFGKLRRALVDEVGSEKELIAAGILSTSSSTGESYCPFAGRAIFPVRDAENRVVGFGARAVPGITRNETTKFINTRQNEVYDKSHVLYGANLLDEDVKTVVVCEGYMDALAVNVMNSPGIVGVAACGTSITRGHIELIGDESPRAEVLFLMDGDDAGVRSVSRLLWAAEALGDKGFAITIPKELGKDPWDLHLSGELARLLDGSGDTLTSVVLSGMYSTADSPESFRKLVAEYTRSSSDPDFNDSVLRHSAKLEGESMKSYAEILRRVEVTTRRRKSGEGAPDVSLSAATRHLVSRLMQSSVLELSGVSSTIAPWCDDTEDFVSRWLPTSGELDVKALGYSMFPMAEQYDSDVIDSVSSCITSGESPQIESIEPVIRSMGRLVVSKGASVSRVAPEAVMRRVRAARSISASSIRVTEEVDVLVMLIDLAREIDRLEEVS